MTLIRRIYTDFDFATSDTPEKTNNPTRLLKEAIFLLLKLFLSKLHQAAGFFRLRSSVLLS